MHRGRWAFVWRRATRAAGLEGVHFHDLRHHAGTLAEISDVASTASFDVVRDQGARRVLGFLAIAAAG
jgi:hypothetical protein